MIFKYQKIDFKITRPIIPITLQSKNKILPYRGLIDSGADYTVFDYSVADFLGIKFSPIDRVEFRGLSGKNRGSWGLVRFNFEGVSFEEKVAFTDLGKVNFGILGQVGFFNHFTVNFSYQNQTVELVPNKP